MIILNELAQKLESILNGVDSEINSLLTTEEKATRPDYAFVVEAQGFHIDHIMDQKKQENFIPVFVSSMGGQFNPVKGLKQGNYVIPISFYFPVRFKDDFFKLGDYLINCFVGQFLDYGLISGKAVSNLSAPTYGEIVDLDLAQFNKWADEIYQTTVNRKNEPFMSMNFNLYLTTAGSTFVFGNAAKVTLKYGNLPEQEIVFANSSIQSTSQTNSQQELEPAIGEHAEAESLPFGTAYGAGFTAYVENNEFWFNVMQTWMQGNSQSLEFTLKITIAIGNSNLLFQRTVYVESINVPIQKGQLITATFSFGKKAEVE